MDVRSLLRRLSVSFGISRQHAARETEPPAPWHYPLTTREAEVAGLVAAGWTNDEIATRFGFRTREIDGRVAVIMNKLNVGKRADIAAWVALHRPA